MRAFSSIHSWGIPSLSLAKPKALVTGSLCAAIFLVGESAAARLNLPQTGQVVTLSQDATQAVRDYFARPAAVHGELSPELEQLLVGNLPGDFRGTCREVTESWGSELGGTEEWRVRLLYQQPEQVWLGYRCGSPRADLSQYFDERPALLRFDAGTLQFFPVGPDFDNDSTLYHIEFAEPLALEGAEAVALRVASSSDNPCCGGTESISEQRLVVYTESARGVSEALSLVTHRENKSSSDNPDVDTDTVYHAEVKFERDSNNRVISATVTFHEEVTETTWETGKAESHPQSQRSGSLRHRWNPASFRFEEAK